MVGMVVGWGRARDLSVAVGSAVSKGVNHTNSGNRTGRELAASSEQ